MAPIKSSLARTVGKLLSVQKDTDLSLRGDVQSIRKPTFVASGGTKSTFGDYTIHTFTSSGAFTVDSGSGDIDVLLVAGGGSGGVDNGGGGGGGGVVDANVTVSNGGGPYTITVGAGGVPRPGPYNCGAGKAGENSTAFGLTAQGGGAGTGWGPACTGPHSNPADWEPPNGGDSTRYSGGCGGGQSSQPDGANDLQFPGGSPSTQAPLNSSVPGVNSITQYGNAGGAAPTNEYGGGGGGAGGAGGNTSSGATGVGGDAAGPFAPKYGPGIGYDDGTPGSGGHFAGGGTGGWDIAGSVSSSTSTSRNGITKKTTEVNEDNCAANTGAGGHGANHNDKNSGGGGSGICIVRYLT